MTAATLHEIWSNTICDRQMEGRTYRHEIWSNTICDRQMEGRTHKIKDDCNEHNNQACRERQHCWLLSPSVDEMQCKRTLHPNTGLVVDRTHTPKEGHVYV
ncbi:hypothetical protein MAR_009209 [Mya arenaria]|uniref:Uncharacterized protein n=1 Tax=Mya arenaria TaxID=6604 RepID=A0ABY7E666_MYAAR|nr:hypothetical protein MAR_009209 [Mya arenaria]